MVATGFGGSRTSGRKGRRLFFRRKKHLTQIPDGFDLNDRPKVAVIVETTIPPVSRANLRMYWLAKGLIRGKKAMVNMIAPSMDLKSRRSYFVEWIWMNQFPGFARLLYSKLRLPVRIWHFLASIISIVILELWYRRSFGKGFAAIHAWNPLAGLSAVIAAKLIRVPALVDFTDFYSDIARTDMPLLSRPLARLENYVLKEAAAVFVVSEALRAHLIKTHHLQAGKVFVVPDGTDSERFRPDIDASSVREKLDVPENAPLLVFHGDIKNDDGVDVLCRALALVLEKRPDARLLILGGGGPYFDGVIKPLIDELGVGRAVIRPGWIPHDDVPVWLNACDIGAMTMRATLNHDHYLSFKLFEYWACGKPVVCTRLKAIGEIVKHGENGLVVDNEDHVGFAEALLELINDPEAAGHMGRAGRELVEREYDWREIMKKECLLYTRDILGERQAV